MLIDGVRESKQDAIREITEALYLAGRTEDARLIEEALWDREACRAKDHGISQANGASILRG